MSRRGSDDAWMRRAACTAPETRGLPWTTDEHATPDVLAAEMRAVCAGCPVRSECVEFVTDEKIVGGWWAGHDRAKSPKPDQVERVEWLPVTIGGRVVEEQAALPMDGAA